MRFNTAISRLMEFINTFTASDGPARERRWRRSSSCSRPFAPHLAEELWQILGPRQTLAYEPWPTYDPALLKDDEIEIPVQVNGKLRGKVRRPGRRRPEDASRPRRGPTRRSPRCSKARRSARSIVVPGKLVNFCCGGIRTYPPTARSNLERLAKPRPRVPPCSALPRCGRFLDRF